MRSRIEILISTWNNGVFVAGSHGLTHELPGLSVRGLSDDLDGGVFAAVDGHSLYQRSAGGDWRRIADSDYVLSVTYSVGGEVYLGTDDACVLRLNEQSNLERIDNFDLIEGRDSWFAGTFVVEGKVLGPPLGIRSLSGADTGCLLASVHVGGIPRSLDSGETWAPTIDVQLDVHEVRVSPFDANLVVAATAMGLCISRDAGFSWSVHTEGLHESNCSAVALTRDDIFVAASENHFSKDGAIYRRSNKAEAEPMERVGAGLPDWLGGIADTSCIASSAQDMAIVTSGGDIYSSADAGKRWLQRDETVAGVSSVQIVRSLD